MPVVANYHLHKCPKCNCEWACTEIACKDKALQRLKCYVCKERKRLGRSN